MERFKLKGIRNKERSKGSIERKGRKAGRFKGWIEREKNKRDRQIDRQMCGNKSRKKNM